MRHARVDQLPGVHLQVGAHHTALATMKLVTLGSTILKSLDICLSIDETVGLD